MSTVHRSGAPSGRKTFLDLPPELRVMIYDEYIAGTNRTTLYFARGLYLPPPLAFANRQIREEFLPMWKSHDMLCDCCTRHIRLAIFDADHYAVTEFWQRLSAHVDRLDRYFESVRITLVFTTAWDHQKATKACDDYRVWMEQHGDLICERKDQHWDVLDERRFGPLKRICFLAERLPRVVRPPQWRHVFSKEAIAVTGSVLGGLANGLLRGVWRGRWIR